MHTSNVLGDAGGSNVFRCNQSIDQMQKHLQRFCVSILLCGKIWVLQNTEKKSVYITKSNLSLGGFESAPGIEQKKVLTIPDLTI